jgi:hypothetical protein
MMAHEEGKKGKIETEKEKRENKKKVLIERTGLKAGNLRGRPSLNLAMALLFSGSKFLVTSSGHATIIKEAAG